MFTVLPSAHGRPRPFRAGHLDRIVLATVVLVAIVGASLLLLQFFIARLSFLALSGEVLTAPERLVASADGTLLVAVFGAFGFPLLSISWGFAMAQGSASSAGGADYKAMRLAEALSGGALGEIGGRLAVAVRPLVERYARALDAQQLRDSLLAAARRATLDAVNRIQELEAGRETAARIESDAGLRRLAVRIEGADRELVAHRRYGMSFRIATPCEDEPPRDRIEAAGTGLRLTLHLFGDDVRIENDTVELRLPDSGSSTAARTDVTPLRSGRCGVRVFVTRAESAEVLQALQIELLVEPNRASVAGIPVKA